MPLNKSNSPEEVTSNLKKESKPTKEAIAIALEIARKMKK